MSKGNSALKVIRTAIKRVNKGWTKGTWTEVSPDPDGPGKKVFVCMESAMYGYCHASKHGLTPAQIKARDVVQQIINERYPGHPSIPSFNDDLNTDKDNVLEVFKLAIIRLETGGDEGYLDDDEVESLLDFQKK